MRILLAGTATQARAQNLIVNGGFETPATPVGGANLYVGGQTFGGWTVTGVNTGTVDSNYGEAGIVFNAGEGAASLDITGLGNTGPTNGVFQTIDTVAGTTYRVNFLLRNADGSANPVYLLPSSIGVSIDDGATAAFVNGATTTQRINRAQRTLTFVATAGSTKVAFLDTNPAADNFAGLDGVSVQAVPEPATWGMMLLGFGLAGAGLRRRKAGFATA